LTHGKEEPTPGPSKEGNWEEPTPGPFRLRGYATARQAREGNWEVGSGKSPMDLPSLEGAGVGCMPKRCGC